MSEMPSLALRFAWRNERISAFNFSEIARPAASSPARTMRSPADSFSSDLFCASRVELRVRCAARDCTFVAILKPIPLSSKIKVTRVAYGRHAWLLLTSSTEVWFAVVRSYGRFAKLLHPERRRSGDAFAAYQCLLVRYWCGILDTKIVVD